MTRATWDETWLTVADAISRRSKCSRRRAGCVLVSADQQLIAAGYNGPPRDWLPEGLSRRKAAAAVQQDCSHWCPRARTGGSMSYDDCVASHSEPNALMFADHQRLQGGTAYITSMPCLTCAKNLANSGISRVVCRIAECDRERQPELALALLRQSGISVTVKLTMPRPHDDALIRELARH